MIVFDGLPALSAFRLDRLNIDLERASPGSRIIEAWYVYFVAPPADGKTFDADRVCDVLRASPGVPRPATLWVVPRLGTISPWSS